MKKVVLFSCSVLLAVVAMTSCGKDFEPKVEPIPGEDPFSGAVPTGYFSYAEISVPAATDMVYIKYQYKDGSTRIIEQPVTPEVTVPTDGKDVEPFGTVKLLFQADVPTKVSVSYVLNEATKANEEEETPVLTDVPVDQVTSGEFGKTRYVQVNWNYAYKNDASTGWQNTPTYPKDVVMYVSEWKHTIRYKFAYAGTGNGFGYFLDEIYEVENYEVKGIKPGYDYCGGCGNCQYCMPWGCLCGCGGWIGGYPVLKANPNFVPNGDDTTAEAEEPCESGEDPYVVNGEGENIGGTEEVTVDEHGTVVVDFAPTDVTSVTLPEPAPYTTTDEDKTMYHSSGVVMFDDRWPSINAEGYRYDFNDVVVDYDIEALTVADELLESEGWREQVKVVLHVRALGGNDGNRVGVVLENFNTDYVDYVDEYYTLDSWQNAHGLLPVWTETTLVENSLRYDGLKAGEGRDAWGPGTALRPAFEIGRLQALNDKDGKSTGGKTSGNEVYQYKDKDHVFNPARRQYAAWQSPDPEQYSADLDALYQKESNRTLANVQSMKLYNTIPGFVNVAGGLYTYTVIYHMKDRAAMSPQESDACKANMMETVVNTTNQNFFLVKGDYGAVGLKGYQPLDCAVKDFSKGYKAKYEEIVNAHSADMDMTTTYKAKNGMVWGFKCPTLTRHTWELMPFSTAYPHYEEWVKSNGQSHKDWYKDADVNTTALVCEW
jgi:hypothetical protein